MVVISGLAIIAGSNPNFFAPIGSRAPTTFAIIIITKIVIATMPATSKATLSNNKHLKNANKDMTIPTITPTSNSFNTTLYQSSSSTSPVAIPRITSVDDWLPAFPPESVSIGMNIFRAIIDSITL